MTAVNPPDSPPRDPRDVSSGIPEGLATKMGKWGTALLALVAILGPLLNDFGTQSSKHFATLATAVGIATILGRMLQSAALLRGAGDGLEAGVGEEIVTVSQELVEVPPTQTLREMFPQDPPLDDPNSIPPDVGDEDVPSQRPNL